MTALLIMRRVGDVEFERWAQSEGGGLSYIRNKRKSVNHYLNKKSVDFLTVIVVCIKG
ncbi:MAG: hypothetical protein IT497_08755 [Ottowia sp.]|nr:hypothetical protein [Ottowia sp.]